MDAKFTFTKATTDERMVIDLPLPGLTQDDVEVKRIDLDRKIVVKVRSTVEDEVAFYKKLIGYKDTKEFCVDPENARFDLDRMTVDLQNGVLRISIPKTSGAIGQTVFPTD